MTKELKERAELALMGVATAITTAEVQEVFDYMLNVLGVTQKEDILNEHIQRYNNNQVSYVCTSRSCGMRQITFLLSSSENASEEDKYPEPFAEDYGTGNPAAFCYVYNVDVPYFSEFGDCFFADMGKGMYHRVS